MNDAVLSFINRPREPGVLTEDDVYLMLAYLAEVGVALPEVQLSPGERRSIGPLLFLDGPVIADAVVDGVRRAPPGLFDEFGVDIEDLNRGTMRGRALRCLAWTLRDMARRADDLGVLDQSASVKDALLIVRSGMVPGRMPGSVADRRRLYVRAAIYYWERYLTRKRRAEKAARPRSPAEESGADDAG